jgi:antitoxin (DNA-binding transcriptional repressor) of toxin-antitoxin stability system
MSRFTATQARQSFARVLDQAAGGQSVTIERGTQRFRVILEGKRKPGAAPQSVIEVLDPAVSDGNWTWKLSRSGMSFKTRTKA